MIRFKFINGGLPSEVGFIPHFLSEADPRPAKEQLNDNYAHGGGWSPMSGWELRADNYLVYGDKFDPEGQEIYKPIAEAHLRAETIFVYHHAWVAIVQPDGFFEVSRMD